MDSSESGFLIGLAGMALLIVALIGGAVWFYGRQSARRMKEKTGKK